MNAATLQRFQARLDTQPLAVVLLPPLVAVIAITWLLPPALSIVCCLALGASLYLLAAPLEQRLFALSTQQGFLTLGFPWHALTLAHAGALASLDRFDVFLAAGVPFAILSALAIAPAMRWRADRSQRRLRYAVSHTAGVVFAVLLAVLYALRALNHAC